MSLSNPAPQPLSIADVERETGLRKDTLRVWERRYGFPTPDRDLQGDRQYDTDQLLRLRLIKQLLDLGHRPRAVVPLPLERLREWATNHAAIHTSTAPEKTSELAEKYLAWLRNGQADPLRSALKRHLVQHGLAQTAGEWIPYLGEQVGDAWQQQTLSVYQEHLFSDVVQSVLREALTTLDNHREATLAPDVLLTTLPNEQHGIGLLAAECFFALDKCTRVTLGTNTPLNDIVEAVHHIKVDIIALSVSAYAPMREVLTQLRQLRQQLPHKVELWVGGASSVLHSKRLPEGIQAIPQVTGIPARIAAWRHIHLKHHT